MYKNHFRVEGTNNQKKIIKLEYQIIVFFE